MRMEEPVPEDGETMARLDFLVLGPIGAKRDGSSIPVGGIKQRTILAMLAASPGTPVSLEQILDAVYGEDGGEGARNSVYTYVSAMRRDLGRVVVKETGGYVLNIPADWVDARHFEGEVHSALSMLHERPETAATVLRRALEMWRGYAYADVDGHGWFQPEVTRLTELRLVALEARIEADLELGRHAELLGELEALAMEYPLRERLRALQMLALYRSGRQTEALRSYEHTRVYLAEQVGIHPSPELQHLESRILEHDPDLDLPRAPSLTERAIVVLEIAAPEVLAGLAPSERGRLATVIADEFERAVIGHGGTAAGQRGTALFGAMPTMKSAIDTIGELKSARLPTRIRVAADFGEVEVHDSGDITGPPMRRGAALVSTAHPGQVLMSAGAQQRLLHEGEHGWTVRSLGAHPVAGVDRPQQVFQLVFPGDDEHYPDLILDSSPASLPVERGVLAGYELREAVLSDLSGTTYRAYQPSAGREVMITVIDPIWANRPDFVSRFEVETQLVTRLQHPHIVPVYDYWRDPTGAYLVSPPVGSPLSRFLDSDDVLDEAQRRRLIHDLGEALSYAHRLGVTHGSISPSSVVIDDSGNAYLTGAGFVMRLSAAPRVSPPSSTANADGDDASVANDIHSFGALMRLLLADLRMTTELEKVIEDATATKSGDRYATMEELLEGYGQAVGVSEPLPGLTSLRNPYKGLEAFSEADAGDFYGRADAVDQLLLRVSEVPLVAVVGPSGCGKSSLVEAGLVPALRSKHDPWVTCVMYPGTYPFVELESALGRVAVKELRGVSGPLEEDEQALVKTVKQILPPGTKCLLVIDQFEELFTLTRDDRSRNLFLDALVALSRDARSDTRVVITLRADFFDRPLQHPGFGELLEVGTFPLATPTREELAKAVRLPAESVGASWESGLVEQIIDDVADAPGTLPLLQYALTEVFSARSGDLLTLDDYHRVGGVLGALGSQADRIYEDLDAKRKETARQLFLRLVALQPSGEQTRRRARLTDLQDVGEQTMVDDVLRVFGVGRLLTFDRDPVTRTPTVEVAHEALLLRWPRLVAWISDAREDLLLHQRLADAVAEWEQGGHDDAYLLSRGRLEQFGSWAETTDLTISGRETEYLALSKQRADEDRERRRRSRRLVLSGFALAAVVATVLGVMALIGRQNAASNARLAHDRELAASAFNSLDDDVELSLLLAIEAAGSSDPTIESLSALHESLAAHQKILTYAWPSDQHLGIDLSTVLSPDGSMLVASGGGTYVEVVDVESGDRLWGHDFGGNGITRATFTQDSARVAVTYGRYDEVDRSPADEDTLGALGVHVLEARTGEQIRHLPIGPRCGVVTRVRGLYSVQSETGDYLAVEVGDDANCAFSGDTRGGRTPQDRALPPPSLIDLETGDITRLHDERAWPGNPPTAIVSTDGRYVAQQYEFSGVTRVMNQMTGERVAELGGWLMGLSWDGATALTIDDSNRYIWDLGDGQPSEPTTTVFRDLQPGEFWLSPDGQTVAEAFDSGVLLWDASSGEEIQRLITGLGSNGQVSFSDDGSRALITEFGGRQAALFDLAEPEELGSADLCQSIEPPFAMVESGGGTIAVQAGCPDGFRQFVIDAEDLEVSKAIPSGGRRASLSAEGTVLFHQILEESGFVGSVQRFDTRTGEYGEPVEGLCRHIGGSGNGCLEFPNAPFPDWANDLEISADGALLAMAGDVSDGVTVWDLATNGILATPRVPHLTEHPDRALSVAFSPDGTMLAASFGWGSPELWLISTETWEPIASYRSDSQAPTDELIFTPDGRTLIATDHVDAGVGRIVFIDVESLETMAEIRDAHDAAISQLDLSPDGSTLASAGGDGFVRVWDVATRALKHQIPVSREVRGLGGVDFLSNQRLAVVDNGPGKLRTFTIDPTELLDIARSRVTRGFTDTECTKYNIDPCPSLEEIRGG